MRGWAGLLVALALLFASGCTERRQTSLVEAADEKLAQHQYLEGAELLRKAIAMEPASKQAVKARYKLGFTLESYLRDYEGAISNYEEFTKHSADRVSVYEVQKRIASLYFEQMSDSHKAVTAYKTLIALNPGSLEADLFQFRVAQSYFRQNKFDLARHEYQILLEKYPKSQFNARARYEIGNCYYMEGKYDIAIEALKQVLRHHSQSDFSTEAQFLMAESFEQQDKLQNALQVFENIRGRYSSPNVLELRIAALKKRMTPKK
jgi:TolA-binding protein